MATEKRWLAVASQILSADGAVNGIIKVADSTLFKVKQKIYIKSDAVESLELEIKHISDINTMVVGKVGGSIKDCADVSVYLTADNAVIFADEQRRSNVPVIEIDRYVYCEEPAVAIRTKLVDDLGNSYNASNPLPTDTSVTLDITAKNVIIENILSPVIANTEFSFIIPINTKWFRIQTRENAVKSRYAFIAGDTADTKSYSTIKSGAIRTFENLDLSGKTLYLSSNRSEITYELEIWTN